MRSASQSTATATPDLGGWIPGAEVTLGLAARLAKPSRALVGDAPVLSLGLLKVFGIGVEYLPIRLRRVRVKLA